MRRAPPHACRSGTLQHGGRPLLAWRSGTAATEAPGPPAHGRDWVARESLYQWIPSHALTHIRGYTLLHMVTLSSMDFARNPYSPGAGLRPTALVGRDMEIQRFQALISRVSYGRVGRGLMLSGLRGVGKTVLLNELAGEAEKAEWTVGRLEAHPKGSGDPFEVQLARSLRLSLRKLSIRRRLTDSLKTALGTLKSFSIKVDPTGAISAGIDVDPNRGRADSGYIAGDLAELASDLGDAAAEQKTGVAIFVDELQDADPEVLRGLCAAVHAAAQTSLPFYLIGAGLPSLPGILSNAVTYAERLFEYRPIEHLGEHDSAEVLALPAAQEGVSWDDDAIAIIAGEAGGYPYFLQEYGRAAWDAAAGPDRITRSDVLVAVTEGRAALDAGFFRSRWDHATPAQRVYLTAMTHDGDEPSASGDVAQRLGRPVGALGPTRASLIAKGLLYSPEHGQIAYTVPGMADFVRRQHS